MFDEEERPRPKNQPAPRDLTTLGMEELDAYVAWLEAEIERTKADKARKCLASSAAAQLFKS